MSDSTEDFDVVIVGGRCAGAPLAADLARRGLRVCVLERSADLSTPVASTHALQPACLARLRRLGVAEDVLGTGAPPIDRLTFRLDATTLEVGPAVLDRLEAPVLCVRRSTLDPILLAAASTAGADIRLGCAVRGVELDGLRATGVRTDSGLLRARLVVGADGPVSTIARSVGAREYHVTPPGRAFFWSYFSGAPRKPHAVLGKSGDVGFLGLPTDGDLYLAAVAPAFDAREQVVGNLEGGYEQLLSQVPELAQILEGATKVGKIRTMVRWRGFFREAAGPGWALVGDAGHFKDPTPAQGISDAFRQGERLAQTVEHGLDHGSLDDDLRSWWRWRDVDAWAMYWFACDLGGPPLRLAEAMLGSLAQEHDGPERFMRMLNHEVDPLVVMSPRRAARAAVGLLRSEPAAAASITAEIGGLVAKRWRRSRLQRRPSYAREPRA